MKFKTFILLCLSFLLFSCDKNTEKNILKSEKIKNIENHNEIKEEFVLSKYIGIISIGDIDYKIKNIEEIEKILEKIKKENKKIISFESYEGKWESSEEYLKALEYIKGYEDERSIKFQIPITDEKILEKIADFKSKNIEINYIDKYEEKGEIEINKKIWQKFYDNEYINLVRFGKNFVLIEENGDRIKEIEINKYIGSIYVGDINDNIFYKIKNIEEIEKILEKIKKENKKINSFVIYKGKWENPEEYLKALNLIKGFEDKENIRFEFFIVNDKILEKISEFKSKKIDIISTKKEEIKISKKTWQKFYDNENIDIVYFGDYFVLIEEDGTKIEKIGINKYVGVIYNETIDYDFKDLNEINNILKLFKKENKKIKGIGFYEGKWKTSEEYIKVLDLIKGYENEKNIRFGIYIIDDKILEKLAEFNSKHIEIINSDTSIEITEKNVGEIEIHKNVWQKFLDNKNIEFVIFDTIKGKSFVLIDQNGNKTNIIYDNKKSKIFSDIYNLVSNRKPDETHKIYEEKLKEFYGKEKN